MVIKDPFPFAENLSEARWSAAMNALEANWRSKLATTRDEYQEERMKLGRKRGQGHSPGIVDLCKIQNEGKI
jgi:hypothetical protein